MKLRSSHARLVALATVLYAGTCCAQDASAVEPKAMDALKSMGTYLRTLQTFSLHSSTTTDQILDNGQKVQFEGSVDYRVRRPNALRADIHSDRVQRSFYFDGKTLTQYAPRMHFYGIVNAPPTIAELFGVLSEKYGVDLPLTDLFYWGTNQERVDEVKSAAYIGPAYVGGIDCDHYAFRQQDVDWQVWIQRGQKPLRNRYRSSW
ncbi:DUF2092 domain-containing protein [Cupriavidus basilensis]|nr:DUF2092 domain-containing protein [Cupriavidus basilensis]